MSNASLSKQRLILAAAIFGVMQLADQGIGFSKEILWDQPPDPSGEAISNQVFDDVPDNSVYALSNVVFNADVILFDISVYFTDQGNGNWNGVTHAVLNIFPDDGALDTEDPSRGIEVAVTVASSNGLLTVTTAGATGNCDGNLHIQLNAGQYWIGLTPIADLATFGTELQYGASLMIPPESFVINPGGGLGSGTKWTPASEFFAIKPLDLAITIHGSTSYPTLYGPTFYKVIRGIEVSGGLESLCSYDDDRLIIEPGPTLNTSEAPVCVICESNVTTKFKGYFAFYITSQAGTPGLSYTIELFNWTTESYELFATGSESFNLDQFHLTDKVPEAADYINRNGDVRSRLAWRATGPTINYPWEVRINRVTWEIF